MNMKITASLLIFALLLLAAPAAFAKKQAGDWNSLQARTNSEIAVKARNQKTVFGTLLVADDAQITIGVANETLSRVTYKREEVEKVWLAKLSGSSRAGLGALIGGAAGASVGVAVVASVPDSERDGLEVLAVPFLAVVGAGLGGVIGYFAKKSNRKKALIYQR